MATGNLRLPSEIVEAILALLPDDSIHRFRSVSKSWSSLLVSEEFQKLRFKSSPPELKPLDYDDDDDDYEDDDYGMPLESCDYRGDEETPTESPPGNDYRDIFVWNPFTGVCRKLPDPEVMPARYRVYRAYGFGYDSVADDYKVFLAVRFWYDPTPKPRAPVVLIFSLKTGCWKSVENPDRHLQGLREGDRGVFLNGALHWRKEYDAKITAFDLMKEKFGEVPAPSHPQELSLGYNGIGIVGEYLCMSWIPTPKDEDRIVWVMKENLNRESWVPFIDYCPGYVLCQCNFIADA
ncbi:hypothetical protein Tsubulata_046438 [Turnera subulata]|uniref:F-box domain-containing protein n=1 Tax=Turnera subulata TaxID=218843 RepID=A0A9Q0FDM9_9ROSI|nr:hypothetical protein Tsubulata_046438 [Turnera subulata]